MNTAVRLAGCAVGVVGAAAILAAAVLGAGAARAADIKPLRCLRRPMGVVGIGLPAWRPFTGLHGTIVRYQQELLMTDEQERLIREGLIDPQYVCSPFGL